MRHAHAQGTCSCPRSAGLLLLGAGWALAAFRPMTALAAPVRIEGFGAASSAEATPVLRRNPTSLPNVLEAATALKVRSNHTATPSHGPSL